MGVKTTLASISLTPAGAAKAEAVGTDVTGLMSSIAAGLAEINAQLTFLVNDVLTPAGTEATNIATLQAQITALS